MTPLVTVGIPFHNEEDHLAEAIASVLRQTMSDFELLLVDDGSDDRSGSIAQRFRGDPRVRVLIDGHRRRLPARLNQIVREARGSFVARMDADDLNHPDRFTRQLDRFRAQTRLDAVGTWCALIDASARPFAVSPISPVRSRAWALNHGLLAHATVMARTEWFRAHPYDETLYRAEDRDLWCRTVESSALDAIEAPLYLVRVRAYSSDFLADYRESQRQNRVLLKRYGRSAIGVLPSMRAIAATFAKSLLMTAATRLGVVEAVLRRRGRPPTPDEERLIREALDAVR